MGLYIPMGEQQRALWQRFQQGLGILSHSPVAMLIQRRIMDCGLRGYHRDCQARGSKPPSFQEECKRGESKTRPCKDHDVCLLPKPSHDIVVERVLEAEVTQ